MKKVLFIILLTFLVTSCNSGSESVEVKADSVNVDSVAVADSAVVVLDSNVAKIN